jgi:hypothetical protein
MPRRKSWRLKLIADMWGWGSGEACTARPGRNGTKPAALAGALPSFGRADSAGEVSSPSQRPLPVDDPGHVHAVLVRVVAALDLAVAELLLGVGAGHVQPRDAVDHVDR